MGSEGWIGGERLGDDECGLVVKGGYRVGGSWLMVER